MRLRRARGGDCARGGDGQETERGWSERRRDCCTRTGEKGSEGSIEPLAEHKRSRPTYENRLRQAQHVAGTRGEPQPQVRRGGGTALTCEESQQWDGTKAALKSNWWRRECREEDEQEGAQKPEPFRASNMTRRNATGCEGCALRSHSMHRAHNLSREKQQDFLCQRSRNRALHPLQPDTAPPCLLRRLGVFVVPGPCGSSSVARLSGKRGGK